MEYSYLCLRSILERCILEALLRRVLYCGHSTQYSHLVSYNSFSFVCARCPNRNPYGFAYVHLLSCQNGLLSASTLDVIGSLPKFRVAIFAGVFSFIGFEAVFSEEMAKVFWTSSGSREGGRKSGRATAAVYRLKSNNNVFSLNF